MGMPLIQVKNLVKQFDGKDILTGVEFELDEGQVKGIMGPSGCGKSTLLRCLNLLVRPTSGQIFFKGQDITLPGVDVRRLRQEMGFVFQQFALYRHLTVEENVTLGLRRIRRMSSKEARDKAPS
jgi:polar amino acid transport system ATP-binding protein